MANFNREIDSSGIVVEWENLRNEYKPPAPIKLLFVGESPPKPKTGRFFYEGGPLARHTKEAFESRYRGIQELSEIDFLKCFKELGCFLDDISLKPVAEKNQSDRNYTILTEFNEFVERLKSYHPRAVVTVIKRIDFFVRYAVEEAGLELRLDFLPFPSHRNVARFVDGLSDVLAREIKSGNLSEGVNRKLCN